MGVNNISFSLKLLFIITSNLKITRLFFKFYLDISNINMESNEEFFW